MGKRYGGSLPDPYVPEVPVPDVVGMEGRALANSLRQNQVEDYWRDRGAKKTLADALKSGMTEDQALDDMTGRGFGDLALGLRDKAMQRKNTALDTAEKERTLFAKLAPTIVDQPSLDTAVGYWEKITGRQVPGELRSFTPELPKRLQSMLYSTMSPAEQERARLAQAEESRKSALFPGQVAQQGATLAHTQGTEQRAQELHGPAMENAKSKDLRKMRTIHPESGQEVDGLYDPATGTIKLPPVEGAQAPAQDPQGGTNTPEALKAAVASGKVSRADAEKYARGMGWIR